MIFFDQVPLAVPDPVLNLNVLFKNDTNPKKVNLGVGAFKTDKLEPWVLPSVRKAEKKIFESHLDHEYLPIEGCKLYNQLCLDLILGSSFKDKDRVSVLQTVGGTSALKVASDFLYSYGPKTIYISDPTWPNHKNIFSNVGLQVKTYPYYDIQSSEFLYDKFLKAIDEMEEASIILLHGACHNPTGVDPTIEQWKEIAERIKKKKLLPFFDSAYQGLAEGIQEDAFAIRYFADFFDEMVIASSYSKNFGLYGQRAGTLIFISKNSLQASHALSQLKNFARINYSNPPLYGSRIVKTILQDPDLKKEWESNVKEIRDRIKQMRYLFYTKLKDKAPSYDFSSIVNQKGMFSFCGLKKEQVEQLINKYSIYLLGNGRISIAGLSTDNLDYTVDAIVSLL